MAESKYKYEVKSEKANQFSVSIVVDSKSFKEAKEKVYNRLKKDVSIKGFRPGQAPKSLIEARLGASIYEETLNELLPQVAVEVLKEAELNPLTQVQYHVHKVSDDDGVEFHVDFEGLAKITLPNFKKIKVKKEKVEVKKDEIEAVIKDMFDREQEAMKTKESKEDSKDKKEKKDSQKDEVAKSPDDEWAKTVGIKGVDTLAALKKEVEKQIKLQKEQATEEKYNLDLMREAIKEAKITVPEALVKSQLETQEKNYKERIEKLGLKFEDFLKSREIDMDKLKSDWKEEIEGSIGREILLVEIAKQNNLRIEKSDVEKELETIKDETLKKQYDTDTGRNYIATILIQQKALAWIKDQIK